MNLKKYKPYVIGILLVEAVGFLASILSRSGTEWFKDFVNQPPLSPPAIVFPIVWGILYALLGIGATRIWLSPESTDRKWSLNLFVTQMFLNFFWTLIFFNAKAYGVASIWILVLWIVVLLMILRFRKVDPLAAWLQIPYLAWLTFATYLTFGVWYLN